MFIAAILAVVHLLRLLLTIPSQAVMASAYGIGACRGILGQSSA